MSTAKVFAELHGFPIHFELDVGAEGIAPKDISEFVNELEVYEFVGHAGFGQRPAPQPAQKATGSPPAPVQVPSGPPMWETIGNGAMACSNHGPAKWVPPGVSKNSGKPYDGFWACVERGCKPANP